MSRANAFGARTRRVRAAVRRPAWRTAALLHAALLAAIATVGCSDDDLGGPNDTSAPRITIESPPENAVVTVDRPAFELSVTDAGSGIFCASIDARISGIDYSQFFRNGCDEQAERVIVAAGRIIPALTEGGRTLTVTISDQAGNEATATRSFFVSLSAPPPPPPPPS